jgi:hypothetical protein
MPESCKPGWKRLGSVLSPSSALRVLRLRLFSLRPRSCRVARFSRFLLISGRRIHHSTRPPQALAGEGAGAGEVGEVELAGADGTGNAPLVSGRQAARRQEEGTANPLVR